MDSGNTNRSQSQSQPPPGEDRASFITLDLFWWTPPGVHWPCSSSNMYACIPHHGFNYFVLHGWKSSRLPEVGRRGAAGRRRREEEEGVLQTKAPRGDGQARRGELHRGMVRALSLDVSFNLFIFSSRAASPLLIRSFRCSSLFSLFLYLVAHVVAALLPSTQFPSIAALCCCWLCELCCD